MKTKSRKAIFALAASILLASCVRGPNTRIFNYLHTGEKYYQTVKYQEALIEFRHALEIDPRFGAAHYELGRAYLVLKKPDSALREFNEAVTLDPSNTQVQLELARMLLTRQQLEQSQTVAKNLLGAQPSTISAHTVLAEKYLVRDFPEAIEEFRKIAELEPQKVGNYRPLGATYAVGGQFPKPEEAHEKAIKARPKAASARESLGQFYLSVRKLAEAEGELRATCDLERHSIPPRLFLARTYLALGRTSDAEAAHSSVKSIVPNDPRAYRALGTYFVSNGQTQRAFSVQSLEKAHQKDFYRKALVAYLDRPTAAPIVQDILGCNSTDPQGLLLEGRILLAQRKYDKAMDALQNVVKAAPNSANAYNFLGLAQRSGSLPETAKASFNLALELQPWMPPAAGALASLDAATGDYAEASRQADIARKTDQLSANVASARSLIAKGDLTQAHPLIEKVLQVDPASPATLALLGNLCTRQGRDADAVQRLAAFVQQHPNNARLRSLLGLAYFFNIHDLHRAEANVGTAVNLDSKTEDAYTLLANGAFAWGETEEAKIDFRKAIRDFPRNSSNYMALVTQDEKEANWDDAKRLCETAHDIAAGARLVAGELALFHLEHGGGGNAAVALAQTPRRRTPKSPISAIALGWAYYKLGSYDAAVVQLTQSAEKVSGNPIYSYHLGMAYIAARQIGPAQQSLGAALRTDPHFPYASNAQAALDHTKGVC